MAQKYQHYATETPGSVPVTGNMLARQLAFNIADRKLYTKNAAGTVVELTWPTIWTPIEATANEDATNVNGAIQDHTLFQFPVTANATYAVKFDPLIVAGSDATGDFSWRFAVVAGTMKGRGVYQNWTAADAIQNIIITAAAAANTTAIITGTAADVALPILTQGGFSFTVTNTTTFKFQFGNSASAAGRISRVWKGSRMWWAKLS